MSERNKVPGEVVRAVLFREQPKPEKVGYAQLQTFLVQRPNWSNIGRSTWQLVGGRFFTDEEQLEAVARVVQRETGWQDLSFLSVGLYAFNDWKSHVFTAMVPQDQASVARVDFDSNQGAKWVDVSKENLNFVFEVDENNQLATVLQIAFDHPAMIYAALQVLRDNQD